MDPEDDPKAMIQCFDLPTLQGLVPITDATIVLLFDRTPSRTELEELPPQLHGIGIDKADAAAIKQVMELVTDR